MGLGRGSQLHAHALELGVPAFGAGVGQLDRLFVDHHGRHGLGCGGRLGLGLDDRLRDGGLCHRRLGDRYFAERDRVVYVHRLPNCFPRCLVRCFVGYLVGPAGLVGFLERCEQVGGAAGVGKAGGGVTSLERAFGIIVSDGMATAC